MVLRTLSLLTASVWVAALCSSLLGAASPTGKPNIVFIISDDQGWEDYGFMGHPHIATPRLDKLAAESITFQRGYSPVPLCRPSLATMITGLYPHQHGVTGNDPALPDVGANNQTGRANPKFSHYYETIVRNFAHKPNFVRTLTHSGYVSFQTGKWWEGDPIKTAGFSHAMTVGTGQGERHGGKGLDIGREGIQPIRDFVNDAGDIPFLIWFAPMLPHTPHTPPSALLSKYTGIAPSEPVARYWASVEWFDQTCGELIDFLEEKKLRQDTIIIYVADNGWIQSPDKANVFAPHSKLTPYEGGVRTPIMISWPTKLKPFMDKDHLASSVDLWPTLAALLHAATPTDLPGINLTDAAAVANRSTIYGEQYAHDIADVDHPTKSMENLWVIDGWWKLVSPNPASKEDTKAELFNLKNDPWEKNNLSATDPQKVKNLTEKLNQWWPYLTKIPANK